MKRRIGILSCCLFSALALGVVTSASASAAACNTGGGVFTVCSGGEVYLGELENKNTAVSSVLKGEVLETPTELKGTTAVAKLKAGEKGTGSGKITFTNITVSKPAKCTVKEPVVAEFNVQASKVPAPPTATFTGSKAGEAFTEIEFKNKGTEECPLKNKVFKVTGSQLAEFDSKIGTEEINHSVIAKAAGSNLHLGENKATFEGTFNEVETIPTAKPWALLED
ncbi:MAG: hypothetical protein ACHQHO_06790 [Solirubrobacterales bacterium]